MGMSELSLAQLEAECLSRSIVVKLLEGQKKLGKQGYIQALAAKYLIQKDANGLATRADGWMFSQITESPMLAQRQSYFKDDEFEAVLNDINVIADKKHDGLRLIVAYFPEDGFSFYGRNRSVETFFYTEYSGQIKGLEDMSDFFLTSFVLDCELVSLNPSINGRIFTNTVLAAVTSLMSLDTQDSWQAQEEGGYPLRFQVFDMLMYNGESLMDSPYFERRVALETLLKRFKEINCVKYNQKVLDWFLLSPIVHGNKAAKLDFYNKVKGKGADGIILKNLDGKYYPVEARQGTTGWIKYKVTMSEAVGSDIDAFVSGYSLGDEDKAFKDLVGTLEFSVFLTPSGKQHHLASISGLPLELRKRITVVGKDGNLVLSPRFYNQVAVIEGQDISSRSFRFMHARLVRFRNDKSSYDCTFEETELYNNVL